MSYSNKKRLKQIRYDAINEYKQTLCCADCGILYPSWITDFNHIDPANKTHNIADMIRRTISLEKIFDEIKKCELLCANCHRKKTYFAIINSIRPSKEKRGAVELVKQIKMSNPCFDCNNYYNWYVMDFDHIEQYDKVDVIGKMVWHNSQERVLNEINKCQLVCANCHRHRTYIRKNKVDAMIDGLKLAIGKSELHRIECQLTAGPG